MKIEDYIKANKISNSIYARESEIQKLNVLVEKINSNFRESIPVSIDGKEFYFFNQSMINMISSHIDLYNKQLTELNKEFEKI